MELHITESESGGKGSFTAWDGETRAGIMTLSRGNPAWFIVDHTEVSEGFEGRGVGKQLVAFAVSWARAHEQRIMPLCPFTRDMFERTPEYADVWFT